MCSYESGPKTHGLFDFRGHLRLCSTEHSATFAGVLHECTAEATAEAFHVLRSADARLDYLAGSLPVVRYTPPRVEVRRLLANKHRKHTNVSKYQGKDTRAQRRQ